MVHVKSQAERAQQAARIMFLRQGYNCEQAVYAAACFARGMPWADALLEARSGAAGGERTACGALVGANRVLEANSLSGMKGRLEHDFGSKFGSIMCADLKMTGVSDGARRKRCAEFIEFALQETLEILGGKESKREKQKNK